MHKLVTAMESFIVHNDPDYVNLMMDRQHKPRELYVSNPDANDVDG
jgi:hypothetical protein